MASIRKRKQHTVLYLAQKATRTVFWAIGGHVFGILVPFQNENSNNDNEYECVYVHVWMYMHIVLHRSVRHNAHP